MRKAIVVVVGVGIVALMLAGCSAPQPSDPDSVPWGTPSGTASFGPAPTGAIDVCSLLSVAKVAELSGKPFTTSKNFDNPGYACVYTAGGSKPWFWDVEINNVGKKVPTGPSILIGAAGAATSLNGVAYPAIAAPDGAALQWGTDIVVVSDNSTYTYSRGSTSQYVAVAEALMAAINQSRGS